MQRVECRVCGGVPVLELCAAGEPLAEARIVRAALAVGRDELAIDDAAWRDSPGGMNNFREVGGEIVEATIHQPNAPVPVPEHDAAEPVPLDLEHVVGRAERRLGRRGLHRAYLVGEALEVDLKLVRVLHPGSD